MSSGQKYFADLEDAASQENEEAKGRRIKGAILAFKDREVFEYLTTAINNLDIINDIPLVKYQYERLDKVRKQLILLLQYTKEK